MPALEQKSGLKCGVALSLNQIKDLFKKYIPDDQKILIDVKGLYKVSALKASGMRYWRL